MELTTVWFILIAVLWIGYFTLEGFDFGVGMLLPVLARDDTERRVMINTIGPVWDGNEVWVLVAGGATFAAFPEWYATLFSGFYLPLLLILVALIVRGLAFEYRAQAATRRTGRAAVGPRPDRRLVRARGAVGRRLREHRARRADRRRQGVHRQPVHAAQPVRAARRAGHPDRCSSPTARCSWRSRPTARSGSGPAALAVRLGTGRRGGRGGLPGVGADRHREPSARPCCSCWRRSRSSPAPARGSCAAGRAGPSSAPSRPSRSPWPGCSSALFPDVMPTTLDRRRLADHHQRLRHGVHAEGDDLGRGDLHPDRARLPGLDLLGVPQADRGRTTSPTAELAARDEAARPAPAPPPPPGPRAAGRGAGRRGGRRACSPSRRRSRSARWSSTWSPLRRASGGTRRRCGWSRRRPAPAPSRRTSSTRPPLAPPARSPPTLRHRLLPATAAADPLAMSRRGPASSRCWPPGASPAIEPYLTRYLPALVLATVLPVAALLAIVWLDPLSGLIVALTLPLVPVFAVLVGIGDARPGASASGGACPRSPGTSSTWFAACPRWSCTAGPTAQSATIRRGDRALPPGHAGHAATRLRLVGRARAGGHAVGRAGRGRAWACGWRPAASTSGPR